MTLLDALWLVALIPAAIGAVFIEGSIGRPATGAALARSWAMWGVLAASAASLAWILLDHGLDAALLTGLLVGLVARPLGVISIRFEAWQDDISDRNAERVRSWVSRSAWRRGPRPAARDDAPGDDDWMETAIWRQGRPPREDAPPQPPPPATPKPPTATALRWQLGFTLAVAATWPVLTIGADLARDAKRVEFVTTYLEAMGFYSPAVRRGLTSAPCWGGIEYDWTSEPGDGRACVRDGGYVTVVVERDRTSKDPFARPGETF